MNRFDGFLICSDFDNTLRSSDGTVSEENSKAIKYFQDNGGLFTLATGRNAKKIDGFNGFFVPNTYIILMNGTMIYDIEKDEVVYGCPMDNDNSFEILRYIVDNYTNLDEIRIHCDYNITTWHRGITSDEIIKKIKEELTLPLYKMISLGNPEYISNLKKDLENKFGTKFSFNRSYITCLEVHSLNSGKGTCIKKLNELLGGKYKTIGVGDFENDITLIKEADIGIAVANAPDFVKSEADLVTVSNDENAIAKIIYDIEKGIIK